MGGKHSKREGTDGSTPARVSPSSKVSRSSSLPTRAFARKLIYDGGYGGSFRRKTSPEEFGEGGHLEEYQRLIELEESYGRDNAGFCGGKRQDIIQSCSSKEEVILEEGEYDNVAVHRCPEDDVEGLRESPPVPRVSGRSRLTSFSAPCLAGLVGQEENSHSEIVLVEDAVVVHSRVAENSSRVACKPEEDATQPANDLIPTTIEQQSDEIECRDSDHNELQPLSKPVDKFLDGALVDGVEKELSSSIEALSPPKEVLTSSLCDLDVCQGHQSNPSEPELVINWEGFQSKVARTDREEFHWEALSSGVSEGPICYTFQAQKPSKRLRLRRQRRRLTFDQQQESIRASVAGIQKEENMSGKGKVSLSLNSGKCQLESRRSSFKDGNEIVLGTAPGKRRQDGMTGEEREENAPGLSDVIPDAFGWGLMGQSDPFLGFDAARFFSQQPDEEDQMTGNCSRQSRTPSKASTGRALARKVRGLRASPKPVSSLESCLRAQLVDDSKRDRVRSVSRLLSFASPADLRGKFEDENPIGYIDGVPSSPDNDQSIIAVKGDGRSAKGTPSSGTTVVVELPNLQKLLRGYAARLASGKDEMSIADAAKTSKVATYGEQSDSPGEGWWKKAILPVVMKKRKFWELQQAASGSNGVKLEDSVVASMEALLFSFGVGVGMSSAANTNKAEVERMSQLMQEAQIELQNLKRALERRGASTAEMNSQSEAGDKVGKEAVDKAAEMSLASASKDALEETLSEDYGSVRSSVTLQGSMVQGDQMAELEAELEAELDHLTGGDSVTLESQYSVVDELEMEGVATVVHGDLTVKGLPAWVEEESEDDDYSAPAEPACVNNYAVSPRELTRLLRKLQATRQEELLTGMEEELEAVKMQLHSKEREIELWKDRVQRMSEVSLASASGDEASTPRSPTWTFSKKPSAPSDSKVVIKTSVRSSEALEGQESFHFPLQLVGDWPSNSLSDTDPGEPETNDFSIPVMLGEKETNLSKKMDTNSTEQKFGEIGREDSRSDNPSASDDVCDEFLRAMVEGEVEVPPRNEMAMQAAMDCKPVIDNCQLEKQLVDSVQDLAAPDFVESSDMGSTTPSVYEYSSEASMADAWDHSLDTPTLRPDESDRNMKFHRAKLLVPHPSRRTSWKSQVGQTKLIRDNENEECNRWPQEFVDSSTAIVGYSRPLDSSKSVSEISDVETADYKTSDTPCSVKYIDTNARPLLETLKPIEQKPNSVYGEGVGRAGLNTPVEKVRQQLFKIPREIVPVKQPLYSMDRMSGELSLTVLDKIARWEGLMEGDTPGPATGSDWECQSRTSDSEQQCTLDSGYDDADVFGEENLVLEAEEMLGEMLINRIVEKRRRGSHIVEEAQTALATLERDDGGGADVKVIVGNAEIDERVGSGGTSFLNRDVESREASSDGQGKTSMNSLDQTVLEEYEFFHRLDLRNKDRRANKERPAKEPVQLGTLDIESIPELDLGENSQLSQDSDSSGVRDIVFLGVVGSDQADDSPSKIQGKESFNYKHKGRSNWLVQGDPRRELYGGNGNREDEVRSRRRL